MYSLIVVLALLLPISIAVTYYIFTITHSVQKEFGILHYAQPVITIEPKMTGNYNGASVEEEESYESEEIKRYNDEIEEIKKSLAGKNVLYDTILPTMNETNEKGLYNIPHLEVDAKRLMREEVSE